MAQAATATLVNTVTVSGGSELNTANDTASDSTNIVSSSDMAITKTASPNPIKQGNTLTYTLGVTNNGSFGRDQCHGYRHLAVDGFIYFRNANAGNVFAGKWNRDVPSGLHDQRGISDHHTPGDRRDSVLGCKHRFG